MPRHPECPERLTAIMDMLDASGVAHEMLRFEASEVDTADIARAHPESLIVGVRDAEPTMGLTQLDADTYMSPGSHRAARLAAGAAVEATQRVLAGELSNAFCVVRPPGHHAEIAEAMGFCLFNNIAIAALAALEHPMVNRVAILDFDVHHCNGTVDIFKDDERVLVCSSFQANFYPYRFLDYSNEHIVTTPLPGHADSLAFRRAVERDWLPALERHKPDLILVSAGFDAHRDDPLGEIDLEDDDYAWVTGLITDQARHYSHGRLVSVLEGGYDLAALARCTTLHASRLLG